MPPFISITLIAVVFFVGIPGIGAFAVRRQWRHFRRRIENASRRPILTYRTIRIAPEELSDQTYRFFGALEAIQRDQSLWLRGDDATLAADMTHSEIYIFPRDTGDLPDEPPVRASWRRLGSLTEGTKVFVCGRIRTDGPHVVMGGDGAEPLLVVLYDGPERTLLRRAIWSGRQLNEYWNPLTPVALAGGTLALITIAYVLLRSPSGRLPAIVSLTLASVPLLPLLPPGVGLFFLYRWSWRHGRILRAYRDIVRLPLWHLGDVSSPGSQPYGHPYDGPYDGPYATGTVDAAVATGMVERGAVLIRPPLKLPAAEYTVFGVPGTNGATAPADPMTEITLVPGDPATLSRRCQRHARWFELGSAVILGAGLLINIAGIFVVLQYVVR